MQWIGGHEWCLDTYLRVVKAYNKMYVGYKVKVEWGIRGLKNMLLNWIIKTLSWYTTWGINPYINCFGVYWNINCPKLLDGFNYKSKGDDSGRKKSCSAFLGSQHFGGKGACWSSGMGIKKIDEQVNYLHRPAQTKQQVG